MGDNQIQIAKFKVDLSWLGFSVNLDMVQDWVTANAGAGYTGASGDTDLTLWFMEQPDDAIVGAIQAYWNGLTPASPEATTYKTAAQLAADAAAQKAATISAAQTTLKNLGLSDAAIAVILGT